MNAAVRLGGVLEELMKAHGLTLTREDIFEGVRNLGGLDEVEEREKRVRCLIKCQKE
jgi:hypothetical protein